VIRSSPVAVAATVLVLYGGWIGLAHYRFGHRMTDFAFIGSQFVDRSSTSPAIDADQAHVQSQFGYDGQFFLYIAQDPRGAVPYIDNASYRYGRIVYPLAARALALGRQGAIPFMLVALNVLAVGLGTLALGVVLRRHGESPWYALLFAAYPGIFIAVLRDLSEALAYALAACAVALFDRGGRRRLIASCALFAVAALTRETTAVFALAAALVLLLRDRSARRAALFAAGAVLPYVLYRTLFLDQWLGHAGVPSPLLPTPVPFGGIAHYFPWSGDAIEQLYAIVLPGAFCLALAGRSLLRRRDDPGLWALAGNALAFVVFVPAPVFLDIYASFRVTAGIVVALVLAIPALARMWPASRTWLWLPVVAWMAAWWSLLPLAFQSQF
jgi:hypothetical protein